MKLKALLTFYFLTFLFFHHGISANNLDTSDLSNWDSQTIDWQQSILDLSFLNQAHKPAGKHGFLRTSDESLVFDDGTPARFWGVNIQARALYQTSHAGIEQHAKRLSRLGINLVRIHHHDSAWVEPNLFTQPDDTSTLNPQSLQKLDWWIACLKQEGIYVWLDLQVGREYTQHDGIDDFSEAAKGKPRSPLKGFNYYNSSIQERMQAFNEFYLSHTNEYTSLPYKDDPAIISMLLVNENDLTHHFANALLPNKNVPAHTKRYRQDIKKAAQRLKLNSAKAWRSWEYGDPKIYLNDAEYRFYQKMFTHLYTLGVQSLLVPNNTWGGMSLAGLPSLAFGDMIDVHSYGRKNALLTNPHKQTNLLNWIAAAQVSGKPLSVTEWNVEKFPVTDRFTIPTWLSSIASLQSWDAIMLYGYSQDNLDLVGIGRNYSTYNDPALMAMMPAAALLFRQQHVAPAQKHYHLHLDKDDFFGNANTPTNSPTIRTLTEQSKVTIDLPYSQALPWLDQYQPLLKHSYQNSKVIHIKLDSTKLDLLDRKDTLIVSDTKELIRDWDKGIQTVDTLKSQIINGNIGGQVIKLSDVSFNIQTTQATIAVQSLDNQPLSKSTKILISKIAHCTPKSTPTSAFLCEPVEGEIKIKAPSGLKLFQVGPKSVTFKEGLSENQGNYSIRLDEQFSSPWLMLSQPQPE